MRALKLLFALGLISGLFSGCAKDNVLPAERFIFGTYTVERMSGDGCTLFMAANGKAYADDDSLFDQNTLHFKSSPLENDKYKLADALQGSIPEYMMQHPNTRFGCPGCVDQPCIYVEYSNNGQRSWWVLDSQIDANPQEVRYFAQLLQVICTRMK